MEKGFRDYFGTWLRQPFDFNWTVNHQRARGFLRIHQIFLGSFSLIYGLTALMSVVWAQFGGGAVVANALVMVIAVSSAVLGVLWIFGPFPTERQSLAFAIYADIAVLTVILCYEDAFTAMPGLALLAANGIYIVVLHGPRVLLAHMVFTAAAFGCLYGWALAQDTQSATVVTVRLLVLLPTVVGVPVLVQSHLLALRMGAVDALHDPLTRLLNRRGLDAGVEQLAPIKGHQIGVLAVDIDKFKAINDRFGHDAGDRVLVAVANATRDAVAAVGARAVIGRTGGEEFAVVVEGGRYVLSRVATLLHQAVADSEGPAAPTVSVGLAVGLSGDTDVVALVHDLIDRADAAMYRAKHAGGNRTDASDVSDGSDK